MKKREASRKKFSITFFIGKGVVTPFIVEDLALALIEQGQKVQFLSLEATDEAIHSHFDQHQPDFVFGIDGKGSERIKKLGLDVVFCVWFLDNPFYFEALEHLEKEKDFIFCWDRDYIQEIQEFGFQNVFELPLATNPNRFFPQEGVKKREEVTFVGSIAATPEELIKQRQEKYPKEINLLIEQNKPFIKEYGFLSRHAAAKEHYQTFLAAINRKYRPVIDYLMDMEVDSENRSELLRTMNAYTSRCFGSESLQNYCHDNLVYGGGIDYRTELSEVYQASAISLNVTRLQLKQTVNQRIFDVFAAGGFLLSDYREMISEIFSFSPECLCFQSFSDLPEKVAYYLSRPKEREEISQIAREEILQNHTYFHRASKILDSLQLRKIDLPA